MKIAERIRQILHDFLLTLLDFVYPITDGPRREKLTRTEWIAGSLILVVILLVVVITWINDLD